MEIVYWNEKTEKFVKGMDAETSVRIDRTTEVLESVGHLIGMPDSKSLGKGLFELRILGRKQIRLLYVFKNNKAYIIHSFVKKTWKISKVDIHYARKIQKEVDELA